MEEQGIVDQIIASQHRTLHDMTHRNSPHLTHITSPHKQPDCFISPRNRPHDIKTSQIATTAHHHHGTAEGSFTAKKWFGHRAGRSPCAHSIGKFFLCYIILFSSETSAPGSPGNYLYTVFVTFVDLKSLYYHIYIYDMDYTQLIWI